MKLFRSSLLLLGETAALGWFLLRDIPAVALLPLIPLGLLYCRFSINIGSKILCLNGISTLFGLIVTSMVASEGLFDGKGLLTLLLLSVTVGLMGLHVRPYELERISGWWMTLFLGVFILMFFATISGIRYSSFDVNFGDWKDVFVFYLLVILEPFGMGKDYRAAPLALGIVLIPFGVASYFALGKGAFAMAEFPYLSALSGVSLSAFHHIEGFVLCLFYGAGVLRVAYFFCRFKKRFVIQKAVS